MHPAGVVYITTQEADHGTGAIFQPPFLPSSKQRLCFQAAAKNIRLMTGWDPSLPDSANSCCCFSAHQSKTAAASTLRQRSGSRLPNPTPRLPVIHRNLSQLILKGNSKNCRLDFLPVFLPALQVTLSTSPLLHYTGLGQQASKGATCLLLQATCSIRDL